MQRSIEVASVRKTVTVKAGQERAFEVFAACRWWQKEHSILASGSPQKEVIIEPRVGGRWFERGEDRSECLWGEVLAWDPPNRMVLGWQINGNFQFDPNAVSEVEVRFIPEGDDTTRVELEHRHLERFGETAAALRAALDSPQGWSTSITRFAELTGLETSS
ncbi:MAG: SRPBCC family protein [Methyloceanibacter sp.]|uniref:SRPBCC family protein n=1 Tax=Methyloceanibacter sp. TaxID=1965321 RepID=UPI003D6DA240